MTLSTNDPHANLRRVAERWGDPDGHMAEYWSVERPLIKREDVPLEVGAANMGDGFKLQKLIYTKTFMFDFDSMAPRLGTPFHSHYQDEAWQVVSGDGLFRTDHGAFHIGTGDYLFLPGGHRHQIANLSASEPLVYQVILVPPVTPDSIIIHDPFDVSHLDVEFTNRD
jgi:mannose-6-phosphate isomerase-like protein (cupin superfamily)